MKVALADVYPSVLAAVMHRLLPARRPFLLHGRMWPSRRRIAKFMSEALPLDKLCVRGLGHCCIDAALPAPLTFRAPPPPPPPHPQVRCHCKDGPVSHG